MLYPVELLFYLVKWKMSLLSSHLYVFLLVCLAYQVQIPISETFLLIIYVTHHLIFDISYTVHIILCPSDVWKSKIERIFNKVKCLVRFKKFGCSKMSFVNCNLPRIKSFLIFALLLLILENKDGFYISIGCCIMKKCVSSWINLIEFASIFNKPDKAIIVIVSHSYHWGTSFEFIKRSIR